MDDRQSQESIPPGAPLAKKERPLAAALPGSSTVTEAGRKAGMSKQAAHDAYEALKVKAPNRCEQLGIKRDRVLQRFDHWADTAMRYVPLVSNGILMANEPVAVRDIRARMKANTELAKITGCYGDAERPDSDTGRGGITINL